MMVIIDCQCLRESILKPESGRAAAKGQNEEKLMDTIKLLLAHSDRRLSNQVEVAVLDVCYDQAVVKTTRVARLDEFVQQGGLWDFDLMIVGAEHLFRDRTQSSWAGPDAVARAIKQIRVHRSTPIITVGGNEASSHELCQAGADLSLCSPFKPELFKAEVRALLKLSVRVEAQASNGWFIGSLLRGFQKAKAH
jgi:hypothetical protein